MPNETIDSLIRQHGFTDYKWIKAGDLVVARWVRFKCMFGCEWYGKQGACPPAGVPDVAEIREFFAEYEDAVLFHFTTVHEQPEDNRTWTRENNDRLLKLERDVFLAGYYKTFLLFMGSCYICRECAGDRLSCRNPDISRPSPESFAVDVFSTVRRLGYPIEVLRHYGQPLNKYGFLLVE